MKIARVIPVFKSGDSSLLTNYRPVSVLPVFSKLLGKVVYNRILKYLDKHCILFKNQYGFRKGHSTSFALLHLFEKISSAIDRREHTVFFFFFFFFFLIILFIFLIQDSLQADLEFKLQSIASYRKTDYKSIWKKNKNKNKRNYRL